MGASGLDTARGVLFGILVSLVLWIIILAIWLVFR